MDARLTREEEELRVAADLSVEEFLKAKKVVQAQIDEQRAMRKAFAPGKAESTGFPQKASEEQRTPRPVRPQIEIEEVPNKARKPMPVGIFTTAMTPDEFREQLAAICGRHRAGAETSLR